MARQDLDRQLMEEFDREDGKNPLDVVPVDLHHLIPGFLQRREKEVQELKTLLELKNFGAIKDLGHKLKGTGAGYGFQAISDLGRAMETAALKGDAEGLGRIVESFAVHVDSLVAGLNRLKRSQA